MFVVGDGCSSRRLYHNVVVVVVVELATAPSSLAREKPSEWW